MRQPTSQSWSRKKQKKLLCLSLKPPLARCPTMLLKEAVIDTRGLSLSCKNRCWQSSIIANKSIRLSANQRSLQKEFIPLHKASIKSFTAERSVNDRRYLFMRRDWSEKIKRPALNRDARATLPGGERSKHPFKMS